MSKFLKISLATVATALLSVTAFAQATIEEVIVTAQRTEQSLQDVPIAVSAFTDEILDERQIEFASDIQLQVPGLSYSANGFWWWWIRYSWYIELCNCSKCRCRC